MDGLAALRFWYKVTWGDALYSVRACEEPTETEELANLDASCLEGVSWVVQ
jgi:hypothetical protein